MGDFGQAQLRLTVDIEGFRAELGRAFDAVNEFKNALANNLNFDVKAPGLQDVGNDAKGAGESVKELGNESSSAIEKMANFSNIKSIIDSVSNAFNQIKDNVMGFVQDFGVAEQSTEKLRNNLKNLGQQNYFDTLIKQTQDLAKITPFDDDDIANAQSMLGTFKMSGQEIQLLTPRLADLTAAYQQNGQAGMNLQQVAIMVGKAQGSELVTGLQRVGVVLSANEKKMLEHSTGMEKARVLAQVLDNNFKGLAETLGKTTLGQLQIAENEFKNWREEIGGMLAPVILNVKDVLMGFLGVIKQLPEGLQLAAVAIVGVGSALTGVIVVITAIAPEFAAIAIVIGASITLMAGLAGAIIANIDTIKAWVVELVGGQGSMNTIIDTVTNLWDQLKEFTAFIWDELVAVFKSVQQEAAEVWKLFTQGQDVSGNTLEKIKTLVKDGIEVAERAIKKLADGFVVLIKWIGDFITQHPAIINEIRAGVERGFNYLVGGIQLAISFISGFISIVERAGKAVYGLMELFKGLAGLNLVDAIFNPGKIDESVNKIKEGYERIKDAVTGSNEGSNSTTLSGSDANVEMGPPKPIVTEEIKHDPKKEKVSSSKGKDEEKEAAKDEQNAIEEIIRLQQNKLDIEGDTVEKKLELIKAFQTELAQQLTSVQHSEAKEKIENKMADYIKQQRDLEKSLGDEQKKAADENNKIIAEVDKFLLDRHSKVLTGIEKETADIEKTYKAMNDKINASKLTTEQKDIERTKLEMQKKLELDVMRDKFNDQAENELIKQKLLNEKKDYDLKVKNINDKYKKEKQAVLDKYGETVISEELIKQIEIARVNEVHKAQQESQAQLVSLVKAGWDTVTQGIQQGFMQVWESVFGQANTLFEQFIQSVISKLLEIAASEFFTAIIDVVSGGGSGGLFGFIGGIFRASGGPVDKDKPYVVGEEGWETFVPGSNGYVLNHNDSMAYWNRQAEQAANWQKNGITIPTIESLGVPDMSQHVGGSNTYNFDFGGLGGVKVTKKSLSGLSQTEWNKLIDNDLLPQISASLRRIGKDVVDNTIKQR